MNHKQIEKIISRKRFEKDAISAEIERTKEKLDDASRAIDVAQKAQEIIQQVAKETQNTFTSNISDVVSAALDAVFGNDAYKFSVEFVQKRGKTEVELSFIRDGEKIDPLSSSGGGAVDVASFALRVALWSVTKNSGRNISNTIILDEPFRFLSRELQPLAGSMLRTLSNRLGIQFILVTHNQDIIESADKIFEVQYDGRKSIVAGG